MSAAAVLPVTPPRTFEIGPGLTCDLDLLLAGRMLVQASSGSGKTKTIRRLLEQTHGKVQQLVIDPDGEYHTLRERFDYVLAAPHGGDTMAHPRTAAVLAAPAIGPAWSPFSSLFLPLGWHPPGSGSRV